MAFKIGFTADTNENNTSSSEITATQKASAPRKSLVQVYFADHNTKLTYFNDKFDLHKGDIVYVEGKLEGILGRVTDVNYNFKIKISDYKRVISVADTEVNGTLYMAGSHFVAFDKNVIPKSKVKTWFMGPENEEDEFVSGCDDSSFLLDKPHTMKISEVIAERGHNYYMENKVRYICIDGNKGYAIVEGGEAYEVEFQYNNGEISHLICSCFCSFNCKHEFAAMLQLKETLELIGKHYADKFEQSEYFAAVYKVTLFSFAVDNKDNGALTL